MGARLSQYEDEGYLILPEVLRPDEVAAAAAEIERLHRVAAADPEAGSFQFEPFTDTRAEQGRPVLRKIEGSDRISGLFAGMAANPRVLEVVRELLGPDLLLFRSTLMLKPARHGSRHALHQDVAYWPLQPPTLVTVSIALSASASENGCIQVIPGSHRWPVGEWGNIARDGAAAMTDRTDVDVSELRDVPLAAGSAVLFHSNIVHGSGPNRSDRPRHTALYAYFPPNVRYVPSDRQPRERQYRVVAGLEGRSSFTLHAG